MTCAYCGLSYDRRDAYNLYCFRCRATCPLRALWGRLKRWAASLTAHASIMYPMKGNTGITPNKKEDE